jgi:ssDNA-binding Zn-finger/Zn-ribbon topoisomerase 1
MSSTGMVRYACPDCGKRLRSFASDAGHFPTCTRCSAEMTIPEPPKTQSVQPVDYPEVTPAPEKKGTVPLKLSLPKVGGMETTVSQGTANTVAKVATGGFLVALGAIVMAWFGYRPPRA